MTLLELNKFSLSCDRKYTKPLIVNLPIYLVHLLTLKLPITRDICQKKDFCLAWKQGHGRGHFPGSRENVPMSLWVLRLLHFKII